MEKQLDSSDVNYDDPPIVEAQLDGVDYRIDVGFGSIVAISTRAEGTWAWTHTAEGKWDGRRLRVKTLEHSVVKELSEALARVMADRDQSGGA